MFDEVVVGIGINPNKARRFNKEEMKNAIEKTIESEKITNVKVVVYDGYTAHKAKEMGATFLIRGLRNSEDFEAEEELSKANKKLFGMETIYLRTGEFDYVSSTLVFDKLKTKDDISNLVPLEVLKVIKKEDN